MSEPEKPTLEVREDGVFVNGEPYQGGETWASGEPPAANKSFSMSRDDAIFWIALTIFGTGLYLVTDNHTYGLVLIVVGGIALAWSIREHVPRSSQRIGAFVLAMLTTWAVVGYDIWLHYRQPQPIQSSHKATPTRPALHLLMLGATSFVPNAQDVKTKWSGLGLNVRIWNTGAQSVVTEWSLTVQSNGGAPVEAQLTEMPNVLTAKGHYNSATLKGVDSLEKRTLVQKVGEVPVEGVLLFYIPLSQATVLNSGTTLTLTAKDVYGQATTASKLMGDWLHR